MSGKHEESGATWVDPDDAPEWTDEMFERADLYEGGRLIRRGRPPAEHPKRRVTLRLDEDVVAALRASGRGWQTRVNGALREWIARQGGDHP
ncbi:BrnA antitoxin family protein [Aureimonas leprariae]|uniref:BrnA antitoxin family protein n=1 Tax=Plantimonas leprariae TaxID=2615207 RepID=A0A7V7PSQ6_9HYPH|nr:BrnA antitoxin family protein [Aureimonas leprariae]KAB0682551.1 BrnA antitoxin family protein [Aureimonas leprariae]